MPQQDLSTHTFAARFANLSDAQLSKEEEDLLNKGLRYNPHTKLNRLRQAELCTDLHLAMSSAPTSTQYSLSDEIRSTITTTAHPSTFIEQKTIANLKKKLSDLDLILTKADKGNTITILPKSTYIEKILSFIYENNIVPLKKDPTSKFQKSLKTLLKSISLFNEFTASNLILKNPSPPILYALPKLHKPSIPVRPIVSYTNAPSVKLCKWLTKNLPKFTKFQSTNSIKNSLDLIQKIKNTKVPHNSLLISLDVTNLFSSVPPSEVLDLINRMLKTHQSNHFLIDDLSKLTQLTLEQNYFIFNGNFYSQPTGLPMGAPTSPLFADIFMTNLEKTFLHLPQFKPHISFFYRYVDDIICLWTGTRRQLDQFLNHINNLSPSIKFTLEIESNKSLNFLDLTISHHNSTFDFNIYRKPTYSDCLIPFSSSTPLPHKLSSFHFLIHRLLTVPLSSDNYNTELNTILFLASTNGYPTNLVHKIIKKKKQKIILKSIYTPQIQNEPKKYKRILYTPQTAPLIQKTFKKLNFTPAFYTTSSISHTLDNSKIDKTHPTEKSGIYQLTCNDCQMFYIGKSDRKLSVRQKEHLAAYRLKNPDKSNFAEHLISENHSPTNISFKPIHSSYNPIKTHTLEQYYIVNSPPDYLINQQTQFQISPFLKNPINPLPP